MVVDIDRRGEGDGGQSDGRPAGEPRADQSATKLPADTTFF